MGRSGKSSGDGAAEKAAGCDAIYAILDLLKGQLSSLSAADSAILTTSAATATLAGSLLPMVLLALIPFRFAMQKAAAKEGQKHDDSFEAFVEQLDGECSCAG